MRRLCRIPTTLAATHHCRRRWRNVLIKAGKVHTGEPRDISRWWQSSVPACAPVAAGGGRRRRQHVDDALGPTVDGADDEVGGRRPVGAGARPRPQRGVAATADLPHAGDHAVGCARLCGQRRRHRRACQCVPPGLAHIAHRPGPARLRATHRDHGQTCLHIRHRAEVAAGGHRGSCTEGRHGAWAGGRAGGQRQRRATGWARGSHGRKGVGECSSHAASCACSAARRPPPSAKPRRTEPQPARGGRRPLPTLQRHRRCARAARPRLARTPRTGQACGQQSIQRAHAYWFRGRRRVSVCIRVEKMRAPPPSLLFTSRHSPTQDLFQSTSEATLANLLMSPLLCSSR